MSLRLVPGLAMMGEYQGGDMQTKQARIGSQI